MTATFQEKLHNPPQQNEILPFPETSRKEAIQIKTIANDNYLLDFDHS